MPKNKTKQTGSGSSTYSRVAVYLPNYDSPLAKDKKVAHLICMRKVVAAPLTLASAVIISNEKWYLGIHNLFSRGKDTQ